MNAYSNLYLYHHTCYLPDYHLDSIDKPAYFNYIILKDWPDTTVACKLFGDSIVRVSQNGYRFYLVPEFTYDENYQLKLTGRYDFEKERLAAKQAAEQLQR